MTAVARLGRVATAVVVAVALLLALAALFGSPDGRAWGSALTSAVEDWRGGPADLVRGGLRWIAPPLVLAAVVGRLVQTVISGRRRRAALALVLGLGSFATTQAIKLWLVPFPRFGAETGRELSGHAAMAASALLVFVICAVPSQRRRVAVLAAGGVFGVSSGAVVARWHDAGEVVVALAVAIGWALVGWAWLGPAVAPEDGSGGRRQRLPGTELLVAVPAAIAWLVVRVGEGAAGDSAAQTLLAAALAVLAATAALTLTTLEAASRT